MCSGSQVDVDNHFFATSVQQDLRSLELSLLQAHGVEQYFHTFFPPGNQPGSPGVRLVRGGHIHAVARVDPDRDSASRVCRVPNPSRLTTAFIRIKAAEVAQNDRSGFSFQEENMHGFFLRQSENPAEAAWDRSYSAVPPYDCRVPIR